MGERAEKRESGYAHVIPCVPVDVICMVMCGEDWSCARKGLGIAIFGFDASVVMFGMEQNAASNVGSLRGFSVIDNMKAQLESICKQTASCADILTVAARDSVVAVRISSYDHVDRRLDARHLLPHR